MTPSDAVELGRHAILMSLLISAPMLLIGMLVGLVVSLLQAVTQVQDQTVSFVPKIVAMVVAFGLSLPWLIQQLTEYSHELFTDIPRLLLGG